MEQICTVICKVTVNINLLNSGKLNNSLIQSGKPQIKPKAGSSLFALTLFDKECGILDGRFSSLLQNVMTSKKGETKLNVIADNCNHAIVMLNIFASLTDAVRIVQLSLTAYGASLLQNVLIQPKISALPAIKLLLDNIRKRPLQTTSTNVQVPPKIPKPSESTCNSNVLKFVLSGISDGHLILTNPETNEIRKVAADKQTIDMYQGRLDNLKKKQTSSSDTISSSSSMGTATTVSSNLTSNTVAKTTTSTLSKTLFGQSTLPVSSVVVSKTSDKIDMNETSLKISSTKDFDLIVSKNTPVYSTTKFQETYVTSVTTKNQQTSLFAGTSSLSPVTSSLTSSLNNQPSTITSTSFICTTANVVSNNPTSSSLSTTTFSSLQPGIPSHSFGTSQADRIQSLLKNIRSNLDSINQTENKSVSSSIKTASQISTPLTTAGKTLSLNNVTIKQEPVSSSYSALQQMRSLLCNSSASTSNNNTSQTCISSPSTASGLATSNSEPSLQYLLNSTIDGEPTKLTDLPKDILDMLQVFSGSGQSSRTPKATNLLDERGAGNICGFLMGKVSLPDGDEKEGTKSSQDDDNKDEEHGSNYWGSDSDSDGDINFSSGLLARRRKKRNPTGHIGANVNELYEDPADVSRRNWGIHPSGEDPADTMFAKIPQPKIKKDKLDELFDLMSELPKDNLVEPCQAIKQPLLPHQKMALNWMIQRENTDELPPFWQCVIDGCDYVNVATRKRLYNKPDVVKGGILADDMGLGKTLTTISLILTNHINGKPMFNDRRMLPIEAHEIVEGDEIGNTSKSSVDIQRKKAGYIKPKDTKKSDLNKPGFKFRQMYLQQLGKAKKKKKKHKKEKVDEKGMFSDSDEEEDHKEVSSVNKHVHKIINSTSVVTNTTKGNTGEKKPKFGQKATDRKATLIVCPMSVLSNWTVQFQQHVDPSINLQIYVFYGPERVRDVNYLKKYDIIITTYGTLTCDFRYIKTKGKPSPLHQINWLRVVLDEGHIIRNARSQQTNAMMGLNSARRWLLTGTPIQNRMTDLWSMIKFLRLEPFTNRKWWFTYVVDSMKRQPKSGEIVFNRVAKIVRHLAIRRLKTDRVNDLPLVNLPRRDVVVNKIPFSEDERKVYDAMQKDGKLIVSKYFRMNTVMKNYANVLAIIMRLRQLCCHPKLCAKAVKKLQKAMDLMDQFQQSIDDNVATDCDETADCSEINDEDREKLIQQLMSLLSSGDSEECSICLEQLKEPVITRCAHVFCSNCINEVIELSDGATTCPLCRADIDPNTMVKVPQNVKSDIEDENNTSNSEGKDTSENDDQEEWHSSAKIDFLMKALKGQRDKDPFMKSLVVSQFTSFLDVLQKPLKEEGFHFTRLDGTMTQGARARVIDEFNATDDESPTIMLLSLTAGGVGLNLTGANRVFLLDPAWNPAIEEQCYDRCHRLGQTKDVLIIKVIIEDTVEDRMLVLQQQKRELMEKAFGMATKSPEERRAAAIRDISTLLGLNLPPVRPAGGAGGSGSGGGGGGGPSSPPDDLIALGGNRRTIVL